MTISSIHSARIIELFAALNSRSPTTPRIRAKIEHLRNKLTVLGSDPPVEHELAAFNSLGRSSTNSIVLADPTVAEEHAHIVHFSTGFVLRTLWEGRAPGRR